ASARRENGRYVGCEIKARSESAKSGKFLVSLLTHELGHCLGLGHNFESTKSVMSYFASAEIIRLQNDDRAGLTFHYPEDSAMAAEQSTFGLGGCDPK
ncbi:MAG: matrixin family metalloprotease, partial [Phycisphaerae bacterium]